jgi:hypothetical protein
VLNLAVFGSYVNNQQAEASDIDLLVDLKPECKIFDNYMELKFFLEELLHKKIDLGIKESIQDEVKADIIRQAVYV